MNELLSRVGCEKEVKFEMDGERRLVWCVGWCVLGVVRKS